MHARKIAESAIVAWHGTYGSGRIDVPISAIATLAALPEKDSRGDDVADTASTWTAAEFIAYARHTWRSVIRARPETTHLLHPMTSWIFDDTQTTMHPHAHLVVQAALRAQQPSLTGTDRRFDTDLLGNVLTRLRPKSALQARGQFYTPADISKLIAHMSNVDEHSRVIEPMMGTGGMLRAAAEVMREHGRDPRIVQWVGGDIDEIAVACATVNSMIWVLGRNIVFHAGNTLAPDWQKHALDRREELLHLAKDIARDKAMLALLRSL
ncbi:N-6 DNA methylase [Amycolatopsis aidingensis]|uniref:N-6 DNA methylase n=1 Tax=Amycolatopsis aidingensis TaxID=2842453 RepID=UPI001C0CAA1D|nr:N-6 DNA methylase [Amycolatopsis aidingensis]